MLQSDTSGLKKPIEAMDTSNATCATIREATGSAGVGGVRCDLGGAQLAARQPRRHLLGLRRREAPEVAHQLTAFHLPASHLYAVAEDVIFVSCNGTGPQQSERGDSVRQLSPRTRAHRHRRCRVH